MPAPSLMFEHGFDVKKGWFDMAALDHNAKLSAEVSFDVPRGRVVHLNADGEFEMGAHNEGVAIFLLNGSDDADVNNAGTTPGGLFMHRAVAPTGMMSGVVATGGYEIDNTEYDREQTYTPGDLLTAEADNDDADVGGVITNAGSAGSGKVKQFTDPVIGVVSSGTHKNHNGVMTLSFWSVWLPGTAPV
jgi:hypothetical protein